MQRVRVTVYGTVETGGIVGSKPIALDEALLSSAAI